MPLLLLTLGVGCAEAPSPDTAAAPRGDPATVVLRGACALEARHGGFDIALNDGYSSVGGSIADGVVPITVLEPITTVGDCTLLRRNNPHCDPNCEPGDTCDFDGNCVPYPANQDLGVVEVWGLVAPVAMSPVEPGTTYFDTTIPHPAFQPDVYIELTTASGLLLRGVGVEALDAASTEWVIGERALEVSWAPPAGLGRSDVALRLTVDQHGLTPLTLVCTTADAPEDTAMGCGTPAELPADFTYLPGYTGAEDFAFDGDGYLVSIDEFGSLVGINQAGDQRVILPDATLYGAGTRFLPDGDLVFCDAESGSLVRVDPGTGGSTVVLSGLEYPNGLDVDLEGWVYIAEQISGRVRRIDPATGAYTVVARAPVQPERSKLLSRLPDLVRG